LSHPLMSSSSLSHHSPIPSLLWSHPLLMSSSFIVTASSEFTADTILTLFSCHHHSQSHLSFFHRHNPHTPGKHSCTTDHNFHSWMQSAQQPHAWKHQDLWAIKLIAAMILVAQHKCTHEKNCSKCFSEHACL
jgi:hypothetical protein